MSFTKASQKGQESKRDGAEQVGGSGKEFPLPNSAQITELGHQVDMPVVMREKMEGAFGMDFSAVKLYENRAVSDAGAEAVTRGSRIAFAPGKLDFSSTRGQALLGHEMSHVASQARGEVKGSGFVNDSALEARADQEGLKAARGESIAAGYGGAVRPLSNVSAASAAGPMQAKSGKRDVDAENVKRMKKSGLNYNSKYATSDMEGYNDLPANQWEEKTHSPGFFSYLFGNRGIRYKKRRSRLPFRKMPVDAQSEESYNLLNTQQGTADERRDAYRNLADQVEQNTTPDEQAELGNYVNASEPTNLLLRGQKEKTSYPSKQNLKDEALRTSRFVSSAIEKNRIQKKMNVFRGIPDSKLGEILTQKGLTRAVKRNGGLDHQWIRDNLQKVQHALINTTFADNGFTSTTTEKNFARYWAQHKNHTENLDRLYRIQDRTPEEDEEVDRYELSDPKNNNVPGGHIIHMSLPAGSRSAAIGGAAKVPGKKGTSIKMHEVLVDKGSLFRITGFNVNNDKDAGPDSFNLMMELLSDEEGMEPAGNAVENLIQPNGAGNGLLNYGGNDLLNNGGDDLLIDDDDADNRAVMGDEDAERLKRIMKKGKKKKKKKH